MSSLQPVFIAGSDSGLVTNKKPFLLTDKAYSRLENAYVWRDRVKKRDCNRILGRLRRVMAEASIGVSGASPWSFNLYSSYVPAITPEPNAELEPGSVIITVQAGPDIVFTDQGDGTLTSPTAGATGIINYITGDVVLTSTIQALGGFPALASFNYFPGLPVMGIATREDAAINDEQAIFFDMVYAYIFTGGGFQEFISGTTWTGRNSDFFWWTNYRGINPYDRLMFVTNFNLHKQAPVSYDPIRYTDGSSWTTFQPITADNPPSAAQFIIYQAKIIVPYYGRLLLMNTWEGTTAGGATYASAENYFNRCRFSKIGDPVATDSFRADQFGKGGFIDAPTNEAIISATFFKNTLIVFFERSTWQLRYVGEYGLPFLWERISSDYGSESMLSVILFDEGVAAVGDKAIVSSNSLNVQRIDQQIPDFVFDFRNPNEGLARVTGIRDFQKQIVYWNFCDSNNSTESDPRIFPNRILVYNYMNQTYSIFRDNGTVFGVYQDPDGILWDSLTVFWEDNETTWDDPDDSGLFPSTVMGNHQGFVFYFGYATQDDPGMSITGITLTSPPVITSVNHNLETGEFVYITDLNFLTGSAVEPTNLNDSIYIVTRLSADTFSIAEWINASEEPDDQFSYTPASGDYVGGGKITLLPRMNIETKDFNPYQDKGSQLKLSYVDFLTDVPGTPDAAMTVNLLLNSSPVATSNIIVGNREVEQYLPTAFYIPQSDYAWHRFFATATGQFIRVQMTYSNNLMNTRTTHISGWALNAMSLWTRPGSRNTL